MSQKSCSFSSELDNEDMDEDEIPLHTMSSRKIILKSQISCFVPLNNYSSTVGIPSYYTERKHEEYGTWKYFLRKIACIPLALVYGIFIVWVVSEFILNKPERNTVKTDSITEDVTPQNICATVMETYNRTAKLNNTTNNAMDIAFGISQDPIIATTSINEESVPNITMPYSYFLVKDNPTNVNATTLPEKESLIFKNDSPELYGVTSAIVSVIGLLSFFSRNTRGTMLLILPGLITKHSRKLIFTLILGLLVNGPMNSLQYNFQVALHNTGCMHKSVTIAACIKQREVDQLLDQMKNIYEASIKIQNLLGNVWCKRGRDPLGNPCGRQGGSTPPFSYATNRLQDLMAMTAPSWSEIKSQGAIIMKKLSQIGRGLDVGRKCLTIITIMILIFDAIGYLRSYYTDSSFDNKVIDQSIQKSWKRKHYRILTPLRHWEKNKGYKEKNFTKFTRKEFFKVCRNGLSTFLFFIFLAGVFITDWLLADALQYIKDNQKFNIKLEGMNKNFTDYINHLHGSVMKSCLTAPLHPSMMNYQIIGFLLIAAATSCLLEIYMTRARAQICNLFYPDRAEERADYLHYAISSGRVDRRHNLLLIIRREIERKLRHVRFSPFKRLQKILCEFCKCERTIVCPGCNWRVRTFKVVVFNVEDKEIQAKICIECDRVLSEKGKRLSENSYV